MDIQTTPAIAMILALPLHFLVERKVLSAYPNGIRVRDHPPSPFPLLPILRFVPILTMGSPPGCY